MSVKREGDWSGAHFEKEGVWVSVLVYPGSKMGKVRVPTVTLLLCIPQIMLPPDQVEVTSV
jgi:hypothetical protein